ncbi:MAG: hypothetical protein ABIT36_07500, partial [Steroidobacteraceae bacterium]
MLNRFVMLVAILGLSFTGQTYTSERDRDWLPAGVHVEAVGRDMLINGLPTDVLRLHGAANAQLLRDAFLAQDATHALPQAHVDGWELHARPVAGGLQTLQLRTLAGGDVEAIFATTDLSRGAARATADA